MSDFESKQISLKDEDKINSILKKAGNRSFWACFPLMHSFLNLSPKKTYVIDNQIVCERKWSWGTDYRILFKKEENDNALIEKLTAHNPSYIGYTFFHEKIFPDKGWFNIDEFEYDLQKICWMEGSGFKNLRNSYTYTKRKYPEISTRDITDFSVNELIEFLNQWKLEKNTPEAHVISDTTLVTNFISKESLGTVLQFNDKIVGFEISYQHPSSKNYCVNAIRKVLPSFKQVTEFLQVEHSRRCIDLGYLTANDGSKGPPAQMHFKERLWNNLLPLVPIFAQPIYYDKASIPQDKSFVYTFATVD